MSCPDVPHLFLQYAIANGGEFVRAAGPWLKGKRGPIYISLRRS